MRFLSKKGRRERVKPWWPGLTSNFNSVLQPCDEDSHKYSLPFILAFVAFKSPPIISCKTSLQQEKQAPWLDFNRRTDPTVLDCVTGEAIT